MHLGIKEKPKLYACPKCESEVKVQSSTDYQRHLILCTGPKDKPKIQCCQCQQIFDTKELLRQHFDASHVPFPKKVPINKKRKWHCEYCQQMFVFKVSLSEHCKDKNYKERLNHLLVPRVCEECGRSFKNTYCYNLHKQRHHSDANLPKLHKCQAAGCSRSYTTVELLRRHQRYHQERQYKCSLCDCGFFYSDRLRKHLAEYHKDGQPLTCLICSETFTGKELYDQHLHVHRYWIIL